MFTPMSITSLNQGKDLAHWHIRRLYGEPINPDVDRSEASTEVLVPAPVDAVAPPRTRRALDVILNWCLTTTLPAILKRYSGKDYEIPVA